MESKENSHVYRESLLDVICACILDDEVLFTLETAFNGFKVFRYPMMYGGNRTITAVSRSEICTLGSTLKQASAMKVFRTSDSIIILVVGLSGHVAFIRITDA